MKWLLYRLLTVIVVGGCSSLFDSEDERIPGERQPAFAYQERGEIQSSEFELTLPPPTAKPSWSQIGGSASHTGLNAETNVKGDAPKVFWRQDVGDRASSEQVLVAGAVTGDGKIFAIDGELRVSAYELGGGKRLWQTKLKNDQDDEIAPVGGTLAFAAGKVFAINGKRSVFALDASDGAILWQRKFKAPLRGSPTVADGKVFAIAADNRLFALNEADGEEIWNHVGLAESIFFVGNTAAAVGGDAVVVAYSSGELFALGIENGFELWRNDLSPSGFHADPSKLFFDVVAPPVIHDKTVYVATRAADTIAIDLATGDEQWRLPLESAELPWVAGNAVFLLALDGELLCLDKENGDFLWRITLPPRGGEGEEYEPWHGPLLMDSKLLVVNADGLGQFRDPANGSQIGENFDLGEGLIAAPIVTDGRLYFFTDKVGLLAVE